MHSQLYGAALEDSKHLISSAHELMCDLSAGSIHDPTGYSVSHEPLRNHAFDTNSIVKLCARCRQICGQDASTCTQGRAPTPRWRHTAAQLFDSQLVIFGGENDAGLVNDRIAVLSGSYKNGNLQWWYPRAANIPARSRHAAIRAAVAGGSSLSLIILGGVSETEDAVVGEYVPELLNSSHQHFQGHGSHDYHKDEVYIVF